MSNVEKEAGETPTSPGAEPAKRKREYKEFGHDEEKATRTFVASYP
jgi:hypothetical protein